METQKRAVVLVNTKSRRGQEWYPSVLEALPKHGVEIQKALPLTEMLRNTK